MEARQGRARMPSSFDTANSRREMGTGPGPILESVQGLAEAVSRKRR
jgi:hypothetical protein